MQVSGVTPLKKTPLYKVTMWNFDQRGAPTKSSSHVRSAEISSKAFFLMCPSHKGKLSAPTTQNYILILFKYTFFTEVSLLIASSDFIEHRYSSIKGDSRIMI